MTIPARPARPTQHRFLTVHQVAAVFDVSPMTVYRMIHAKELPAYRIGRAFRVDPAAVDRFLRSANTWSQP